MFSFHTGDGWVETGSFDFGGVLTLQQRCHDSRNFGQEPDSVEAEANGKAIGPPDNGLDPTVATRSEGQLNYAMTDDRGFSSHNKV